MIETIIEDSKNLTLNNCSGTVTVEEIRQRIDEFYNYKPTRNIIWDLSEATVPGVSKQDIEDLVWYAKQRSHSRTGAKTAIVTSDDLLFGMSRMYQVFSESAEQEAAVQVFRTQQEALSWIDGDID